MCYSSLVDQTTPSAALDIHMLVMQYIQCCGGSGLVETNATVHHYHMIETNVDFIYNLHVYVLL